MTHTHVDGYVFDCNPCEGMTVYHPNYLRRMPTLAQGHFDDLKLDTSSTWGSPSTRYWLSRMTAEDGEKWQVHVERLRNGCWEHLVSYRVTR
jgi:hypothetical protein